VFHIRNTPGLVARGGVSYTEHQVPRPAWGCFTYGTPRAFWRGEVFHIRNTPGLVARGGVSYTEHPDLSARAQGFACETPRPWASDGRGYATTPIPSWPLPQVGRSLFPEASGRSGASGFRAVRRVFPGLSRQISCRQKIAPVFSRQKIRGGWIPSGCGEPLREPFSSLKAPYGCRGGRPLSPGPIRPCAAFPWLPTATTLLPPCALRGFPTGSPSAPSGAFPRGLPRLILGFPRGSSPEGGRGRPMGFARTKPRRSPGSAPGVPITWSNRGFSRPSPRALPGKRMGRAWGDGGSGGGDGRVLTNQQARAIMRASEQE